MITTINPYTQKPIKNYCFLNNDTLVNTLNQIKISYENWSNTEIDLRVKLANNFEKLLLERKESLAKLMSSEMGKPITESLGEIEKSATLLSFFSKETSHLLSSEKITNNTFVSYHPTGAVFGIMPWNFPFWQVFRYAIPNILAGNVCVLKHAPNVFGCAKAIEKLFLDAGFPKHVFTNLSIDLPQVQTVIAHPIVQGVCVTGSERAGSAVASLAGKYLKKSVLELGGTDAFAILKDADFNKALESALISRLKNGGQVCIAAKRIFIPSEKLEKAISFVSNKIKDITLGDPLNTNTKMGPIAKAEFLPKLQQQVDDCVKQGAKLIVGGKRKDPFFEPTLLIVNAENPLLKEEIFGPVICLIPFENEDDLIKNINNSDYGLGAAIWSNNINKAKKLALPS